MSRIVLDKGLVKKLREDRSRTGSPVWVFLAEPSIKIRQRHYPSGSIGFRLSIPVKVTGKLKVEIKDVPALSEAVGYTQSKRQRSQSALPVPVETQGSLSWEIHARMVAKRDHPDSGVSDGIDPQEADRA